MGSHFGFAGDGAKHEIRSARPTRQEELREGNRTDRPIARFSLAGDFHGAFEPVAKTGEISATNLECQEPQAERSPARPRLERYTESRKSALA